MVDTQTAWNAQTGKYVVQAIDLPLFDIYECDSSTNVLCVRELAAGDRTSSEFTRYGHSFYRFNSVSLLVDVLLGPVIFVGLYAKRWLIVPLQHRVPETNGLL
jgi:hypothetical protein